MSTDERDRATWVLTGSVENFEINVERGFDVVGFKERRRRQAEQFEPGDGIVFYLTGVQAFGGLVRVTSSMFEDREPIWPQRKKKHPEPYPWRVRTEPEIVLEPAEWIDAAELAGELEHVAKWPIEHWHLAFQGQLRTVPAPDATLLRDRLAAARSVTSG